MGHSDEQETRLTLQELRVRVIELEMENAQLRAHGHHEPHEDARFRQVLAVSPIPIALNDEQLRITFLNEAFVRTFGYAHQDIPTVDAWWPLAYPDPAYRQAVADAWGVELERARRTGTAFTPQEVRLACKDGSSRTVLASAASLTGAFQGEHLVVLQDITQRKQAEQALAATHDLLKRTGELAKVGGWEVDLRTMQLFWAVDTCRILEVDPPVAPTLDHASDLYAPEARPIIEAAVDALLRQGTPFDLELPGVTARGRPIWVRTQGSLLVEDGKPVKLLGAFQDITARKRADEEKAALEERLNQALKMESVGRLAGGVAHDFNNMLGVILAHAEMAVDSLDAASPVREDLVEIRKAAHRSADLTRQLLAFARKQTVAPRVLDLNAAILSVSKMLRRLIGENITLETRLAGNVWPVRMDPSQLDQVLANLCVNARDAIGGQGNIRIETGNHAVDAGEAARHAGAVAGDHAWFSVSDDGSGMDADTLVRIFEPFFTTKRVGEGVGLGLATVYGAVQQNQGFIEVESTVGKGTRFTIHLPRHDAVPEAATRDGAASAPGGKETVLLVEDEPALMAVAKRMLEKSGYSVVAAASPRAALRLAREHAGSIALLMTDVVMPEMNGRELANTLLALHPNLAVLYVSGYTSDVIAHQGVLQEGVHFLQKPFTLQEVTSKVRAALDARNRRPAR